MDEIAVVSKKIRDLYPTLLYDHRPFLPPVDTSLEIKKTEEFRVKYACFKYAVASVLQPKSICEIGVGSGIAARAFLSGSQVCDYLGIDNGHDEEEMKYPFSQHVKELLLSLTSHSGLVSFGKVDSQTLCALRPGLSYDFIHVDASHEFKSACHDLELAWDSKAKWILVDDCRDTTVASAVLTTLAYKQPGSIEWAYFEDTWTGNILINRERTRA